MKRRAGFALIGVMIVLVIASMLVVSWFKSISAQRDQLRMAEDRLAAEWLADGAIDRAAAKLRDNKDYTGETWAISAGELDAQDGAAIEIRVSPVDSHSDRRTIEIAADYPRGSLRRAHVIRISTVSLAARPEKNPPQADGAKQR
jgi:type II secretory pathway pseudopilin PulG